MERLSKDYAKDLQKSTAEAEALDTLRKANRQLSEHVKRLESSMATLNREHVEIANQLITTKLELAKKHDECDTLQHQVAEVRRHAEAIPAEIEARCKDELEILVTKNAALVGRNSALEDQLAYMENMVIDMKMKFAESENERETLRRRLQELKKMMGA